MANLRPFAVPLVALSALLASAAPGSAFQRGRKDKGPTEVAYFDGKLADAQKEARQRNVPVLVVAVLEGEEANDRFKAQLSGNKPLAVGTQKIIVVLVNNGTHPTKRIKVKGEDGKTVTKEVCREFGTATCEVHQRNWDQVYLDYVASLDEGGEWILPSAVIAAPDGKIVGRIEHQEPPSDSEMLKHVKRAQLEAGWSLTRVELGQVQRHLEAGRTMAKSTAWADAWRAWDGILEIVQEGRYADEAKAGRDAALAGMKADLAGAREKLTVATIRDGWMRMAELARDYAGTPVEGDVLTAMKRARRDPELKALIAALDLELEAEDLWVEADELVKRGKRRQAERILKKILGKKYAETPAAARVRAKYPDLAKAG